MPAHDTDIFEPTVAPAGALHRPRLQVRSTAVPAGLLRDAAVHSGSSQRRAAWAELCSRGPSRPPLAHPQPH